MMDRARLLLIGPEPAGNATFKSLEALGYDVRQCPKGVAAFADFSQFRPDLLLLDCRTEFGAGMQLCRTLRAVPETSCVPVVVLAGGEQYRVEALEAGADDCLTQPVSSRESVLRIRAFSRRAEFAAAPRVLEYEGIELDQDKYKVRRHGVRVSVSSMQFRLLRFLMENPTVVFSRHQLLESVWQNTRLDEGAVTACMARLRRALNAAGGTELIRNVPGSGYSLDASPGDERRAS